MFVTINIDNVFFQMHPYKSIVWGQLAKYCLSSFGIMPKHRASLKHNILKKKVEQNELVKTRA